MDHNDCDHAQCTTQNANLSVCQTVSEMDWERGLWHAAYYGDKERVKYLIEKSRDPKEAVNAADNAGYTPLHYAARKGHVDICRILLSNGAVIDAQTKSGNATALHKASASGKLDVVKFLIQAGACVNIQDIDGQTILHKAMANNNRELANFLLTTYPNLRAMKDKKGKCASGLYV
ncbi:ankyrin repeat domain-containing protein 39 [Amyelois transitella]|uniref:ankyrin repeat domain-containing protein 39 n=1 Tax=Amyelois transitella TaxID=680683 RepID=UPI00298FABE7|nr:ankyrin repeat domain-containing protein 39 [Amyelois transitella]